MTEESHNPEQRKHLNALQKALDARAPKEALALLRVLRMSGLKDPASASLIFAFSGDPSEEDYQKCSDWISGHLGQKSAAEELDLFESFGEVNPLTDSEFLSVGDEFSDFDDVEDIADFGDFDAATDLVDLEDIAIDDRKSPDEERAEDLSNPNIQGIFPASEEIDVEDLFDFDDDILIGNSLDDESSFANRGSTAEQPSTRQVDARDLQALDAASQAADDGLDRADALLPPESDFDFALGSAPSSAVVDSQSDHPEDVHGKETRAAFPASSMTSFVVDDSQAQDDDDDDFDFGFGGPDDAPDPLEKMAYAEPAGDFFFPPPLNAQESSEPDPSPGETLERPDATEQQQRQEKPTSEMRAAPKPKKPLPRPASVVGKRSLPKRQPQATPLLHASDLKHPGESRATPPRGTTPLPPRDGMAEEDLLALGEDLARPPEKPYRGEPLIRELGDENTPSHEDKPPLDSFASTASGKEETNPFAHNAPTGVGHNPMVAMNASSFVLEELDRPPSSVQESEAAVIHAMARVKECIHGGQLSEALELVDAVLDVVGESSEASALRGEIALQLEEAEIERLGSLSSTPTLKVSMSDLADLDLDHRAGFILSQIDGMLTFEDILDMSAMDRLETLEVLTDLTQKGLIEAS